MRTGEHYFRIGRTSYENIVEPCCALSCRYPVDRIAERHSSLADRNRPQPASQHHGPGAEAGSKAAPAGGRRCRGKQGRCSPDIASPSNAPDDRSKAGARSSDGEDCRA
jgi:hypothetical protein